MPSGTPTGPGYALTPRALRRLDEAGARIYRTRDEPWDGRWHLLAIERIRDRSRRERVRVGLNYLGYGAIDDTTWIAARPSTELAALLTTEAVTAEAFTAVHDGDTMAMVRRVWDLDALAASYDAWLVRPGGSSPGSTARGSDGGGLRSAQPAGPRVAKVPVHRPRPARPAAAG